MIAQGAREAAAGQAAGAGAGGGGAAAGAAGAGGAAVATRSPGQLDLYLYVQHLVHIAFEPIACGSSIRNLALCYNCKFIAKPKPHMCD